MSAVLSLRELGEKLAAKRAEVRDLVKTHTVDGELKMDQAGVEQVRALNAEMKDLGERFDAMKEAEEVRKSAFSEEEKGEILGGRQIAPSGGESHQGRSLKGMIGESKGLSGWRSGEQTKNAKILTLSVEETKTLLTLGDITPQADRRVGIVPIANAFAMVTDLMRDGNTTSNALEYYEETTFTNNAAETAEGAAKPESALDFTLRTDAIRKIATWIPVTDEVLADNARLESYIRGRLRDMVIRRRERQVLLGDGVSPNLLGIRNRTGVQTIAAGSDPVFDAVLNAMLAVQTTGDATPNGIVLPPAQWFDILKTRTTDGVYIMGNPGDPQAVQRLWGLSVRSVPGYTSTEALVGDFRMAEFVTREGLTVTASTEHSTYFVENKVALLAEERVGLQVDRPAAFAAITGL